MYNALLILRASNIVRYTQGRSYGHDTVLIAITSADMIARAECSRLLRDGRAKIGAMRSTFAARLLFLLELPDDGGYIKDNRHIVSAAYLRRSRPEVARQACN